jgi:hypothetical protein
MESIEPDENLSAQEASRMIEGLMGIFPKNGQLQHSRLNEAWLGMVLKECFRDFRNSEKDILREHRQRFKETVLKTYQLFTEIAKELEQTGVQTEAQVKWNNNRRSASFSKDSTRQRQRADNPSAHIAKNLYKQSNPSISAITGSGTIKQKDMKEMNHT